MEPIENQAPTSETNELPDELAAAGAEDSQSPVPAEEEPVAEVTLEEADEESPAEELQEYSTEQLLGPSTEGTVEADANETQTKAMLEALVYITEEPLTVEQIATALDQPKEQIERLLNELIEEFSEPQHGLTIREVAGGFKMGTKPEHHEAIRQYVKNLKPPLKLSLAALETLAVIAYKQPITSPEIMEIRGVSGTSVMKTLLDRKLIATAGRKNVIGKPMLYKTTRDFLVQFGLKDLAELPTLKEFEELRRLAIADEPVLGLEQPAGQAGDADAEPVAAAEAPAAETPAEEPPQGE